ILIVGVIASFDLLYPIYPAPSQKLLYDCRLFIHHHDKYLKVDTLLNSTEFEYEYNDGVRNKHIPGGIVFCYFKVNSSTPATTLSTFKNVFKSCIAENEAQLYSLKKFLVGYHPSQYPTIQQLSYFSLNDLEMTLALTRSYLPTIFDYSFCKTSLSTSSFLQTFCIFNDGFVNTDLPSEELLCKFHYTARQQSEYASNTTAALADMYSLLRELSQTIHYHVNVACYQASNANAVCTMVFRSAIKNDEKDSISFIEILEYTDYLPSHLFNDDDN
ncbi:hypothetical protein PRIPAC_95792, partial [Pristionchus pacificus]|uniref:Uncharacterized protein n=1 Tax=Pristionchus pacificus TaxID=54126 RepID=A0A2A6B3F4_PRIPA